MTAPPGPDHVVAQHVVAERDGVVLRHAHEDDLPALDKLTTVCYRPIQESYVELLGEDCYEAVRSEPELAWDERKVWRDRSGT